MCSCKSLPLYMYKCVKYLSKTVETLMRRAKKKQFLTLQVLQLLSAQAVMKQAIFLECGEKVQTQCDILHLNILK